MHIYVIMCLRNEKIYTKEAAWSIKKTEARQSWTRCPLKQIGLGLFKKKIPILSLKIIIN